MEAIALWLEAIAIRMEASLSYASERERKGLIEAHWSHDVLCIAGTPSRCRRQLRGPVLQTSATLQSAARIARSRFFGFRGPSLTPYYSIYFRYWILLDMFLLRTV